MRRKYSWVALAAALLLAALLYVRGGGRAPAGQVPLINLTGQNADTVRTAFNAAQGDARVLLLLSPT